MGLNGFPRRVVSRLAGKALLLVAGLSVTVLAAGGCQSKMYEENKALREQNLQLQARVDERNAMNSQEAPITPPEPAKPVEPPVVVVPPAPEPAPAPVPAPPADLGGEVTVDPVAGTTTVNFVGDALFDSGKATLKQSAKANLDKMAAGLKKQYAGMPVMVQGHSDSDPIRVSKWKSNQELSEARAKAVRDYLVQKGVEAGRITAEGFGDAKPKSSTDKARNRRVEVVVMTK